MKAVKKVPLSPEDRIARRTAVRFSQWKEKNPKATLAAQVQKFDEISDQEYIKECVVAS